MERQTIPAGWLTLRPFTAADIPWVYDASREAGFLIEATLRRRLTHRGTRVDAWLGFLLKDEAPAAPGAGAAGRG